MDTNNYTNHNMYLNKTPVDFQTYKKSFDKLQKHIKNGNSYLANLTFETKVELKNSLLEIYKKANSKYKLYYKDKFVSFSPEQFINIKNNKIFTYPMKGTIDAFIPNAKEKILQNQKELAEHTMVVDLLRNDLGIISKKIKVEKFRYIQKIKAGDKELLQISSKISGQLLNNWQKNLGDILVPLLPAGSITGTPKRKTVQILDDIEDYNRGYFTGVFGIFDGDSLDSAVLIRFIQKKDNNSFVYKSGGGITSDSDVLDEYNEMIDKVYIP
jgi:para-aminobenzoate synthetase component 1